MLMPAGTLYINVHVSLPNAVIRVQTPGIGADLATVKLSTDEVSDIIPGETKVKAGTKVTATLTLPPIKPGQTLTLESVTGRSTDGLWSMVPVEVTTPPSTGNLKEQPSEATQSIKFTMPSKEVILCYTISSKVDVIKEPSQPDGTPVETPEIAYPSADPSKPVLVITKQIETEKLQLLLQELEKTFGNEEGTLVEMLDISLQIDGSYVQPNGKVTVTYPYPKGTDKGWCFRILHQISDDPGKPVSYETIYPQSLTVGLRFTVEHFSPFAILYTPPLLPEGSSTAVAVTGVSLPTTLSLKVGASQTPAVGFTPENATDKRLEWQSANEAVVKVSAAGKLTGVAAGTAVVTVRSVNGGFTATCRVTVKDNSDPDPTPDPDPSPDPDPDPNPPVSNATVDEGAPRIRVSEGCLSVESGRAVAVRVYSLTGREQSASHAACSHRLPLPAGIWLVNIDRAKAVKIIIP